MKSLFERTSVAELKERLSRLTEDSQRQWGSMNSSQMLAHCAAWMEMACGDTAPKRSLVGRFVGHLAKNRVLSERPLPRNMPTEKTLLTGDDHDFASERKRLLASIDRFSQGPEKCTRHPHCFFGPMSPAEWSQIAWKHLDHHFQQFGV